MGYQLIETIEVGSGGAASIEFTGIPQDGVDLAILLSGRTDYAGIGFPLYTTINSDTTSTYVARYIRGDGSSVVSQTTSTNIGIYSGFIASATSTSNSFENLSFYIPNYSGNAQKSFSVDTVGENNATTAYQNIIAGLWPQTSAITTITMTPLSSNFVQHSTASLYKITAD